MNVNYLRSALAVGVLALLLWQPSSAQQPVTIISSALPSGAATQTTLASVLTELQAQAANDVPSGDADTGNPVKIGGYASSVPCSTSGVANGDRVNGCYTLNGASYVQPTDGSYLALIDPCSSVAKTTTPISLTADTVIIAAASSKKTYICGMTLVADAAEKITLTEGTGSTCGSSEAALIGSTTDSSGVSLGAHGGFAIGSGSSSAIVTAGTNVDVCLNVSAGSVLVAGYVTWVQRIP